MNPSQSPSPWAWYRRWWPPLVVGVVGAILSVTVFQITFAREQELIASEFGLRAQEVSQAIERRVRTNFETVNALAGYFISSERVTWQEFQVFGHHLLGYYEGVDSVQWLPHVTNRQRRSHETTPLSQSAYLRVVDERAMPHSEPAPSIENYRIRELAADGMPVPAGEREHYVPIYYLTPWSDGHPLWGLDLATFERAAGAMAEARRTGELVATPPIHARLVWVFGYVHRPEDPETARATVWDGFVAGAFRIDAIVEGTVGRYFLPHAINVQVWDDSGPGNPVLLYGPVESDSSHAIEHVAEIELGRRGWRIVSSPDDAYVAGHRSWTPPIILGSGMTASLLLVLLLVTLINRSERIRYESAERATRERQQAVVAELGLAALSHTPLTEIMEQACAKAAEELEGDYAELLELQPGGRSLLLCAGVGWKPGYVGEAKVAVDRTSQAGYTLEAQGPVTVDDFAQETRFTAPRLLMDHGAVSGMTVIVHAEEKPFGVLGVHTVQRRRFSHNDAAFIQAIANVLGQAIGRHRAEAGLRESEQRFRNLADATPALIWMSGLDKGYTYFNRQWRAFTGRTLEQEYDAGWTEGVHPEDQARRTSVYASAFDQREPFRMEYRLRRADGVYRWLVDEGRPRFLPDGRFAGYVGACIDVTAQKEAAEKLRDLNETLERRVTERTSRLRQTNEQLRREIAERERAEQALQDTADALKRSNQELEQFAYIASHDLQEPLRKVEGFGQMLQERLGTDIDEQGRDYLQRMYGAVGRMRNLIDGLLAYSRVTTKASPFEAVDLNAIAREVVSDLEVRIRQTNGRVELHPLPTVDADPLQMRQLLQNLIANGLKFHRPDVAPVVEVWTEPLGGEDGASVQGNGQGAGCRLFVRDNGIGIDPEHQARLFTPFRRLHGRSSPYEGTGIGLALCRKIAQRHGGRIEIQSAPDRGATFIVTLVCEQAAMHGEIEP
ncbi:MAG: ATP-binding protein [Phycisphaeraceae bacterium]